MLATAVASRRIQSSSIDRRAARWIRKGKGRDGGALPGCPLAADVLSPVVGACEKIEGVSKQVTWVEAVLAPRPLI